MKIRLKIHYFAGLAILIATSFSTFAYNEELSEYIRPQDLKEFHFPLDTEFRQIWFQFYVTSSERDTIRTLVNAGAKIVPSTIAAIRDKKLFKRRYAISALGYLHDRSAIQALTEIIRDDVELPYFRGDALESLFQIDEALGKVEARRIVSNELNDKKDLFYIRIAKKIICDPNTIPKELMPGP